MNLTQIALSTDYESMQQLIVAQKRRDSPTLQQSPHTQEEDTEIIIAPTLMEEKEQDNDHMFDQEQEPVITEITMHYSYHEPSSDMDELELEESEQDEMDQDKMEQDELEQDELEQDELEQDESKQDELKQDESKQDELKHDESKQEETEEKKAIDHCRVLLLREEFLAQFHQKGFTEWIADEQYDQTVDLLAKGYIGRDHQQHSPLPNDVYGVIIHFYAIKKESFGNNNNLVEVQSGQRTYFTLSANISLSKILVSRAVSKRIIIELKEIKTETLEHILEYLGHHNGGQPAELLFPSGNSMELSQTVQDPWEAKWIAKFDDETISKIVFAAQWLGLRHLKRLANNAKIALIYAAWLQTE